MSSTGNCDKEVQVYDLAKQQPFFQSNPKYSRKSKKISLSAKTKLCEAPVLSTLLYNAELWPVFVTQIKNLEAAHYRWQRSILEDTIRCKRLRWLGHLSRMECHRIDPRHAYHWEQEKDCMPTSN